jgi:hypothetical protein
MSRPEDNENASTITSLNLKTTMRKDRMRKVSPLSLAGSGGQFTGHHPQRSGAGQCTARL